MHGKIVTFDGVVVGEDDEVWGIGMDEFGRSYIDAEVAFHGKIRSFTEGKVIIRVDGGGERVVFYDYLFKHQRDLAKKQLALIQEKIDASVAETKRLRKVLAEVNKIQK